MSGPLAAEKGELYPGHDPKAVRGVIKGVTRREREGVGGDET